MNKKHLIVMISFAVAFGVVAYLGWAMLIKPVRKQIAVKEAEKGEVEKKLQDAKTKATQYDKFRAQAENIRRDLNLISLRLDSNFSQRERSRMIARVFYSVSSLDIASAIFEKREKSKTPGFGTLDELPVTITLKGGFHELGLYLNSVISNPRIVVPGALDLKISKVDDGGLAALPLEGTVKFSLFLESGGGK